MKAHPQSISLAHAGQEDWDVIIVGAGMGGGAAAYALAKAGHKVLLVDKGHATYPAANTGVEVEQSDAMERLQNGKWPTQVRARVDGKDADIWAPLGCGLGGSTLLYAAALQRLEPMDFEAQAHPDGGELRWPFAYEVLEPYYEKAEKLFAVKGAPDPRAVKQSHALGAPPAMCERDQHYFQEFKAAGLHPYRLHVAMEYQNDCGECGGHICARQCKRDAYNSCIVPAMNSGELFVLTEAEVESIDADSKRVKSLRVKRAQDGANLSAKIVVLSAGAYMSPVLLLRSKNDAWPQGLANKSGLVGRNLMFHASDFIAFWPRRKYSRQGPNKTIALRDFYKVDGKKYGEFQSTGLSANFGIVLYGLRLLFDQSKFRHLPMLRHFLRFPAYFAAKLYGDATVFTTIVEDFPYPENRVLLDEEAPGGMRFEYRIHEEFRQRVGDMNKNLRQRLSALRSISMNIGVSLNYGHPCGTCKAGMDDRNSVVDANCKAHGIDNLYIVDSAFMPTSGGTNPSLTIAANALRVADVISAKLKQSAAPAETKPDEGLLTPLTARIFSGKRE